LTLFLRRGSTPQEKLLKIFRDRLWLLLHTPPTTHYHLSAFNYEDYGMKAIVFITDEEDIMKIEKGGISND
jgi:hypothetical protein